MFSEDDEALEEEAREELEEFYDRRRGFGFIFRPRVLIAAASVVMVAVLALNLSRMVPDLSHRREFVIRMSDIEFTQPPEWVPNDFVDRVFRRAGLPDELPLLEESTMLTVADAFAADPWVADIHQVQKDYPSSLRIHIEYREPVAMVRMEHGFYPIDSHGTILPPRDFTREQALQFPIVTKVKSKPKGLAGSSWDDPAVVGAARIAAAFVNDQRAGDSNWERFELSEIVAPHVNRSQSLDDLVFELVTSGGSRIIWGRAPGVDHPAELTVVQKIGRMDSYIASYGSFEDGTGTYELDIRHWHEITRRAIAIQPDTTPRF